MLFYTANSFSPIDAKTLQLVVVLSSIIHSHNNWCSMHWLIYIGSMHESTWRNWHSMLSACPRKWCILSSVSSVSVRDGEIVGGQDDATASLSPHSCHQLKIPVSISFSPHISSGFFAYCTVTHAKYCEWQKKKYSSLQINCFPINSCLHFVDVTSH